MILILIKSILINRYFYYFNNNFFLENSFNLWKLFFIINGFFKAKAIFKLQ